MMFPPSFIIVLCNIPEGAENTFKVMLVLKANVVLNQCDASRPSVFRNGCACHIHLRSSRHIERIPGYKYYSTSQALEVLGLFPF
jgi:hypothetical protein